MNLGPILRGQTFGLVFLNQYIGKIIFYEFLLINITKKIENQDLITQGYIIDYFY